MTIATNLAGSAAFLCPPQAQSGRPFKALGEAALFPDIVDAALRRTTGAARIVIIPELRGPYGVADIAVLRTTDEAIAARLALDVPPLVNQLDAAIVSVLSATRPIRLSTVARRLGWPERTLAARAASLVRRGVVGQSASGALARPPALSPLGHLDVYEAKINDWRRGCDQAATYATWADSSALGVARLPRNSLPVLQEAARLGVGLIVGSAWRLQPPPRRLPVSTRLWASEFVVAALQ